MKSLTHFAQELCVAWFRAWWFPVIYFLEDETIEDSTFQLPQSVQPRTQGNRGHMAGRGLPQWYKEKLLEKSLE